MKKHHNSPLPVVAETNDLLICRLSVVYNGEPYSYLVLDKSSKDGRFHSKIEKTFLLVSGYMGNLRPYAYAGLTTHNCAQLAVGTCCEVTEAGENGLRAVLESELDIAAGVQQLADRVRKSLADTQTHMLKHSIKPAGFYAYSFKGKQLERIADAAAAAIKSRR